MSIYGHGHIKCRETGLSRIVNNGGPDSYGQGSILDLLRTSSIGVDRGTVTYIFLLEHFVSLDVKVVQDCQLYGKTEKLE